MHSQARIGGTQILVKHAMIQVYVYFKILLTCIFLLFILWYTMLKVSLHAEDYYLVIENDHPNFAYNFFALIITFFPSLSDAELQQLQNPACSSTGQKGSRKAPTCKKVWTPKKGPKERPVFLHNSTSGQAVTLKCCYDQKNVNTKVTQVRT